MAKRSESEFGDDMNNLADFGEDSFCPEDPERSDDFDALRSSDRLARRPPALGEVAHSHPESGPPAFEIWNFLEVLRQRSRWLVIGAGGMAALGLVAGLVLWKTKFTATAQLVRHD